MAVIQISKVQVRRGLQENLPQLASGELGWSIDSRRLYIGNGTLAEGAPEVGITEILTIYSNGSLLLDVADLRANVANLQSNVTTINSTLSNIALKTITLSDNRATLSNTNVSVTSLHTNTLDYNIIRGTNTRIGTLKFTNYGGTVNYTDDYSQTAETGIVLLVTGNVTTGNAILGYTSTNTGADATFNYYLKSFV